MVICLGSLFQPCCREGETLPTNVTGVCGACSQCLGPTGFAPAHGVSAFPVYIAQAPGCSAGELSKVGPGLRVLPGSQVQVLGYSTKAQTRSGRRFVPFPGPSSSGDQVLGQCTLPRWAVRLITSPSQPLGFLCAQRERCLRRAVCLLWGHDLWQQPSRRMATVQDPRKTCLATGSLLVVW